MTFEKSNLMSNIYGAITLTTDSNCLLTSKKFCTLPPQPGGLFDMAGFNGENIYR